MTPSQYGPVNYGADQYSPLGAGANHIRYADMVQQQMVSQYQQDIPRPATMTLAQMRRVATENQYQYGVPGGQDAAARTYMRQTSLNRLAYSGAVTGAALGWGGYYAGAAATAAMGIGGGIVGGMIGPMALAAAPAHFINRGMQNTIERQRYMHTIAGDIESNRDRLGFASPLSYNNATSLGERMSTSMSRPGFFSKDQQMEIHKIALSNDMISAKGKGLDSGTVKQYEKNFKDLVDTAATAVKLLNTTKEGAMSVIKELNQGGFSTTGQIKQQLIQAKAFGAHTGLGSQNMMQIGAAGAMASQGTPYTASNMAGQFQSGAMQAHSMMAGGGWGANAVKMAGGVAQAGATIATTNANIMMSGIGTKMMAYSMKADGTLDEARFQRLTTGGVGAYEVVSGANERGYAMGTGGRVLFERNRNRIINEMSSEQQELAALSAFNMWSKQGGRQYAPREAQAEAFASMFHQNSRDRDLYAEYLLAPKNFTQRYGERQAVAASMISTMTPTRPGLLDTISKPLGRAARGLESVGENIIYGGQDLMRGVGTITGAITGIPGRAASWAINRTIGLEHGWQGWGRADLGDPLQAMRNLSGVGMADQVTQGQIQNYFALSSDQMGRVGSVRKANLGTYSEDIPGVIKGMSAKDFQWAQQQLNVAMGNDTLGALYNDPAFLRTMQITKGGAAHQQMLSNQTGAYNAFAGVMNAEARSATKKADEILTFTDQQWKARGPEGARQLQIATSSAKYFTSNQRAAALENYKTIREAIKAGTPYTELPFTSQVRDEAMAAASLDAEKSIKKHSGMGLSEQDVDMQGAQRAADVSSSRVLLGLGKGDPDEVWGEAETMGGPVKAGSFRWMREGVFGGDKTKGQIKKQNMIRRSLRRYLGHDVGDMSATEVMSAVHTKLSASEGTEADQKSLGRLASTLGYKDVSEFAGVVTAQATSHDATQAEHARVKQVLSRAAGTVIGTATHLLNREVTAGERTEINQILTGQYKGTISKSVAGVLGTVTGQSVDDILKMSTKDVASQVVFGAAQKHDSYHSDRKALIADALKINSAIMRGIDDGKTVTLQSGKELTKEDSAEKLKGDEETILNRLKLLSMSESKEPGTQVSMQPPVMNYWNNRWSTG